MVVLPEFEGKMAQDVKQEFINSCVKDLTTLRREIRALLISSKHGCTPEQLQSDYVKVMGDSIPYHFHGHSNFMSLINSMPDVVSVCRSRNNVILYGIADEKTKKIKDMVAKQRSAPHGNADYWAVRMNMITKNTDPAPKVPEVCHD